ncbi:hypothetical protein TNCV_1243081 [Trichonephila clavipes]|nr:hypothetical protein TNCV_1243081 [Trichonephila clavipes]
MTMAENLDSNTDDVSLICFIAKKAKFGPSCAKHLLIDEEIFIWTRKETRVQENRKRWIGTTKGKNRERLCLGTFQSSYLPKRASS